MRPSQNHLAGRPAAQRERARPQDDRRSARHRLQAVVDDAGATAVEYALLIAFISAVIIGAVATLGLTTAGLFVVPCLGGPTCP